MICIRLGASEDPVSNANSLEYDFLGVEGCHLHGQIIKAGMPLSWDSAWRGGKCRGQWPRRWYQWPTEWGRACVWQRRRAVDGSRHPASAWRVARAPWATFFWGGSSRGCHWTPCLCRDNRWASGTGGSHIPSPTSR